FPGSLDDHDACRAVRRAGGQPVPLWHGDRDLKAVDAVILPGGFSYGDYLRCGAIARFAPVMTELIPAARAGLPGLVFVRKITRLGMETAGTRGRSQYAAGQEITAVLKSGEGAYLAAADTLTELEAAGRVLARYAAGNPNGSAGDIAGVVSEAGNVVGLMPHPEHAIDELTGPSADGLGFFASLVHAVAA